MPKRPTAKETAKSMVDHWNSQYLASVNKRRGDIGDTEINRFYYVIDGLDQCFQAESMVYGMFEEGAVYPTIKAKLKKSGSTALASDNIEEVVDYLSKCISHGNSDMDVDELHRQDSVLLYITWVYSGPEYM